MIARRGEEKWKQTAIRSGNSAPFYTFACWSVFYTQGDRTSALPSRACLPPYLVPSLAAFLYLATFILGTPSKSSNRVGSGQPGFMSFLWLGAAALANKDSWDQEQQTIIQEFAQSRRQLHTAYNDDALKNQGMGALNGIFGRRIQTLTLSEISLRPRSGLEKLKCSVVGPRDIHARSTI